MPAVIPQVHILDGSPRVLGMEHRLHVITQSGDIWSQSPSRVPPALSPLLRPARHPELSSLCPGSQRLCFSTSKHALALPPLMMHLTMPRYLSPDPVLQFRVLHAPQPWFPNSAFSFQKDHPNHGTTCPWSHVCACVRIVGWRECPGQVLLRDHWLCIRTKVAVCCRACPVSPGAIYTPILHVPKCHQRIWTVQPTPVGSPWQPS